jgi:nucleoside-diphosphate-sugar epimerase
VHTLASTINRMTGNTAGLRHQKRRHWDTNDRLWASVEYAREILGYEPRTQIEEGLARTAEWFERNWGAVCASARFEGAGSADRSAVHQPVAV